MNLPEAFLARMKKQLGAEYDAFVASYDADTSYGLRLNLLKGTVDEIIPVLPFALTNVPWIPEGSCKQYRTGPGNIYYMRPERIIFKIQVLCLLSHC